MSTVFPERLGRGYSFGLKKNIKIPFPIVKVIHREAGHVHGRLGILDEVVFLVSDDELLIFFWAIFRAIDHPSVLCCRNMITILVSQL